MAFSLGEEPTHGMTEINLLPLIDIMLVLMIIFLVTASVANPSIVVNLPKTDAPTQPTPLQQLNINITADDQIALNGKILSITQLDRALRAAAQAQPTNRPTVMLKADKDARYDNVAQVMATAANAGLSDIAFISER